MFSEKQHFTDREARDAKYWQLKELGVKGLARYTTHDGNDPKIIWVVSWDEKSRAECALNAKGDG